MRLTRAARNAWRFARQSGTSPLDLLRTARAMRADQELTWSQVALAANAPMMTKASVVDGDLSVGILPTGQVVGSIEDLPSVAELVHGIVTDASAALGRVCGQCAAERDRRGLVDLTWSDSEEAFRAECREWLAENVPRTPMPSGDTAAGFAAHLEWERALHAARWAVVSWPAAYGGRDASLWEWLLFEEEYYAAGAPQRITQNGIFLLAPTIFEFGTQVQQDHYLPRMSAAQDLWCQGWSEPNAGSDLAGITSKAVRDDAAGGWRLNGQKTWTTRGAFCTHVFGLFRTDPEAERHRGLTYFMAPLDAEGVTVRGLRPPRRRRGLR